MAVTLLRQPEYFKPVYSTQEYELYDSVNYAEEGFYYQIDITYNGEVRSLKQLPNQYNKAVFDIQTILQSFIESEFASNVDMISINSDLTHLYFVTARSYWNDGSSFYPSVSKKFFNGVDRYDRDFNVDDYEFNETTPGKFLMAKNSPRDIHIEDNIILQCLYGQEESIDSSMNGITITSYPKNGGAPSSYTYDYDMTIPDVHILNINVTPSTINDFAGGLLIHSGTDYYTVQEKNGLSETLRINVVTQDERFDRYYRLQYIDSLGATEGFNFNMVPENNVSISKYTYINGKTRRQFATKVDDKYLVRTDWVSEEESKALKDLWYAPKVALQRYPVALNDDDEIEFDPIILDESSKLIKTKRNEGTMFYQCAFTLALEYQVQQQ